MFTQPSEKSNDAVFEQDPHSYAEPDKVSISHVSVEIAPNFKTCQIVGFVELTLCWNQPDANALVLDTYALGVYNIEALNQDGNWETVPFTLGEKNRILGSALSIDVNAKYSKVRIEYQTSVDAPGLQWLEPSQTSTKKHPFLYTHGEAILTRSWMPIQDTPAVRMTYDMYIRTPVALRAVMSAENDPDHPLNGEFRFSMKQKVPAYLIAFAVGNITAQTMSKRSTVYAEPDVVANAAAEFEDTERMIEVTETLFGPYQWDKYDMLVMPPSFPMGGMENPRMTFVTPTILAGDKSLVSVIAHELAHSWSGNLVTNAAWRHVWLNEGFTSYVENRIVEAIYGKEQADEEFLVYIKGLYEEMRGLSNDDQQLVPEQSWDDPDLIFTDVAYIKGAWFLKTLEEKFGRAHFDDFLRKYFNAFTFQSITTEVFEQFLQQNLIDQYPDCYTMKQAGEWIHAPGIPADAAKIESESFVTIDALRQDWVDGKISTAALGAGKWSINKWQHFLNGLSDKPHPDKLKELDATYHLTGMRNQVVAARWYKIAIACEYTEANPAIRQHLITVGRRLLVVPLYEELLKTEPGKLFAQKVYCEARAGYHAITRKTIDEKFEKASVPVILPEDKSQSPRFGTSRQAYFNQAAVNEGESVSACDASSSQYTS